MRSIMRTFRSTLPAIVILAAAASGAHAGGHDRVRADSYGNLVIDSAAGYKRILVGEGSQVKELSKYTSSGQSDVDIVYADAGNGTEANESCYRAPYLIKGRSYMYGFDEGVIPFQGGPCR